MPFSQCAGRLLHILEILPVAVEISHLLRPDITAVLVNLQGRYRILDNSSQESFCQVHAVLIHQEMKPCHHPERLGISLKMAEVLYHLGFQNLRQGSPLKCKSLQVLLKPILNGCLAKVAKRGIPDIVNQSGTLKNVTHRRLMLRRKGFILDNSTDALRYVLSQRFSQG